MALCGIGVSEMWHCVVWDTLLVSILGPAWRQSRTLGGVASQPAYTYWQDEEEDFGGHQHISSCLVLVTGVGLQLVSNI